jgi:hypothetical protein
MANRLRRRWTLEFLRELVFGGDSRLAAEWVGVSHSHVWMRRLREPKFAGLWDAALRLHAQLAAGALGRLSPCCAARNFPLPRGDRDK